MPDVRPPCGDQVAGEAARDFQRPFHLPEIFCRAGSGSWRFRIASSVKLELFDFLCCALRNEKGFRIAGGAVVSVVVADDHVVVRQGLRALLESDPKFVVVGEAADGLEAVELVKRRKPRVLIVDLMMPSLDGLETTQMVLGLKLKTRVIILSVHGNEAYVLDAMRKGAAGYVVKESCGAELFQALRVVVAGGRYLSPTLLAASVDSYSSKGTILQKAQSGLKDPYDTLTQREQKVLQLVVEGATSGDIRARLKINSGTAESLRANLMRKLGLHTRQNLIHYALQRGVIPTAKSKSRRKKAQQLRNSEAKRNREEFRLATPHRHHARLDPVPSPAVPSN
jgi:two-component system response regulator NreC